MPTGGYLLRRTDGTVSSLNLAAGTATAGQAPLYFTLGSAVVLAPPVAGVMEMDANGIPYYTHATSERGVVDTEQFISLTSGYQLASQQAAQKIFNSSTNGSLTVASSKSYFFECRFFISGAATGAIGFAIGGGATLTSILWISVGTNVAINTATQPVITTLNTTNANTNIISGVGYCNIRGIIRINVGGTIIPQVNLANATTPTIAADSYFRLIPIGTNTVTTVGNWS